ncbi:MAG: DUF1540 domain-containing protein [Acutalibacteraceae bacterium]
MDKCNANHSIRCSVVSCNNHCTNENYCSLDTVSIGTHESHPSECECVDCESFVAKSKCTNC